MADAPQQPQQPNDASSPREKLYSEEEAKLLGYEMNNGNLTKKEDVVRDEALANAQAEFIVEKAGEIQKDIAMEGISAKVDQNVKKSYKDAMIAAKSHLKKAYNTEFTPPEIQGGKRTRRMSKTRNRKTKNKRRKLYKR